MLFYCLMLDLVIPYAAFFPFIDTLILLCTKDRADKVINGAATN